MRNDQQVRALPAQPLFRCDNFPRRIIPVNPSPPLHQRQRGTQRNKMRSRQRFRRPSLLAHLHSLSIGSSLHSRSITQILRPILASPWRSAFRISGSMCVTGPNCSTPCMPQRAWMTPRPGAASVSSLSAAITSTTPGRGWVPATTPAFLTTGSSSSTQSPLIPAAATSRKRPTCWASVPAPMAASG